MYRTVLLGVFATVMCLGVTASLVLAKPVKHGAVEICSAIDGGEVTVVGREAVELVADLSLSREDADEEDGKYSIVWRLA